MASANTSSTQYLSANDAGSITDSQGNIWTIVNGTVDENGTAAGYTANVAGIATVGDTVWQENSAGLWWSWNGTDWGSGNGIAINPIGSSVQAATGVFQVANGQIVGPDGTTFIARGIDVMEGNQPSVSTLQADFPGINFVRLAMYDFADPSSLASYVNSLTSQGIVVELEDHTNSSNSNAGGGSGQIFTGGLLQNELSWYSAIGAAFKDNPYVWFGTNNEPSETDSSGNTNPAALSDWQLQTYDAVRNSGNNSPILLEANSGGPNNTNTGYNAADYSGMTNTVWDIHYYGWLSGYSTDQGTVSNTLTGVANAAQQITSADGTMPVIIGEYGNSTTGQSVDPNGDQVITAVQQSPYGSVAWAWSDGYPGDGLTANGESTLSSYGQQVASGIAAAAAADAAAHPAASSGITGTGSAYGAASTPATPTAPPIAASDTVAITTDGGTTTGDLTFSLTATGAMQATVGAHVTALAFTGDAGVDVVGGPGSTTISATGGRNSFTAGTGSLDITGGSGADAYVFQTGAGSLTIEDFSTGKGDTLTIDGSLQAAMSVGSDNAGGTLLTFGGGTQIDLRNTASEPGIIWT